MNGASRRFGAAVLAAALGLLSAMGASGAERLRVGGPTELPPYAYVSRAGEYTGFSVDLLRAAGETLGIDNVLFYPGEESENLKALTKGQVDCLHFVRYSSRLAQDFTFAAIYLESPSVIFVASSRYDLTRFQDLAGKRVAVLRDDPAFDRLRNLGNCHVVTVASSTAGFQQMMEDKADAFVGERLTSLHWLGDRGLEEKFKVVGEDVAQARYGVLVRKDEGVLASKLESAFRRLDQSGKRDRTYYQWFGEEFRPTPFFARPTIRWVMIFVGASLLVAIIVLGWNLLLQRELELKAIAVEKAELDKRIAEEKSRFEAIVQSMTEGVMLVDLEGRVAYVNAPGVQYLGRRVEDLMGQPLTELNEHLLSIAHEPERLARKLELTELNPTRPAVIEYLCTTSKRLDIRLKFFPVRDRLGEFSGRGILIEDITHEREVERLKSEFVSIASHELRTPMTSILGFSEIMLTKVLPPDLQRRYTSQIHGEAERLTRILNDMLDLTHLESGEAMLEKKPLQLSELVQEVVENFRAQLKDRHELQVHVLGEPQRVAADHDKLVQVLWNLISNADKYSPPGQPVMVDVIERGVGDPAWSVNPEELALLLPGVELKVTDFGQGIPADQLAMIFMPFYRVETAVHTIRGTGLGLAIVKRIVEAHGGRVWVKSEPGKVTEFSVLLPAQRPTP